MGKILKNETAHEKFTKYLKRGKHRVTPERFEVLDYALDYKGHFGADDLYIQMKTKKSNVSRATIYNTLELLAKCSLLAKRNFGDGITRYESSYNRKNHDHLICINCGNITEFTSPKIQEIVQNVCEELGFESAGYSFNIFGKCKQSKSCKFLK
ncbi:MAG: transcriptional repressor [Ignavibacteriae bacterium]|nr:transcriptional repressor [Ignavibacteriota bacterium]